MKEVENMPFFHQFESSDLEFRPSDSERMEREEQSIPLGKRYRLIRIKKIRVHLRWKETDLIIHDVNVFGTLKFVNCVAIEGLNLVNPINFAFNRNSSFEVDCDVLISTNRPLVLECEALAVVNVCPPVEQNAICNVVFSVTGEYQQI